MYYNVNIKVNDIKESIKVRKKPQALTEEQHEGNRVMLKEVKAGVTGL